MSGRKSVPKNPAAKSNSEKSKKVAAKGYKNPAIEAVKNSDQVIQTGEVKNKSVDLMAGDELKAYAKKVGISQRDIDGLTEDRLRQNCKVRIYESLEG